jgi:hypothetical protein
MKAVYFVTGAVIGAITMFVIVGLIILVAVTRPVPPAPKPAVVTTQDMVLSFNEAYLTRQATASVQSQESVIRAVTVDVKPQSELDILLEGQFEVIGFEIKPKATLTGHLQVNSGSVQFQLQKIDIAGIEISRSILPRPLLDSIQAVETSLSDGVRDTLNQGGLVAVGVNTDESSIMIACRAQ